MNEVGNTELSTKPKSPTPARVFLTLLFLVLAPFLLFGVAFLFINMLSYSPQATEACRLAIERFSALGRSEAETFTTSDLVQTPLQRITPSTAQELELLATISYTNGEPISTYSASREITFNAGSIELYQPNSFGDDLLAVSPTMPIGILIVPGASAPSFVVICDRLTATALHWFTADETTNAVRFHSRGGFFALNEGRGTFRLFDGQNFRQIALLDVREDGEAQPINELALHPSENLLAFAVNDYDAGDFSIRVWDTEHQDEVANLSGDTGEVIGLDFDEVGTLLASSSLDGTIRLWGIPSSP